MLLKTTRILVAFLVIFSTNVFANYEYFDVSLVENGVVIVRYPISDGRYKAMIEKDGKTYYYDLTDEKVQLPLQMGKGTYKFAILKKVSGDHYNYQYKTSFDLNAFDEEAVYLNGSVHVNFKYDDQAILYLDEWLPVHATIEDKVEMIHRDLVTSLHYDHDKFSSIQGVYFPDIDHTFATQSGICYDFASLFAAMLRSEGIPTKLIMGYRADTPVYHAWNEVFINGEWKIIDITLDNEFYRQGFEYELFKDDMFYTKDATY